MNAKFWLRDMLACNYMKFCRHLPLEPKKVVFKSDRGTQCVDSPLALYEELRRCCPDYDLVWVVKDPSIAPRGCRTVQEGTLSEIRELATAGYWVDNKRKGCWVVKRNGQIYIQTWHGAIFLKHLEKT